MIVTNRHTGARLDDGSRVGQYVETILTTPIGTRVMRGDFGSELHALLALPLNAFNLQRIRAASIDALRKWLPTLSIDRAAIEIFDNGIDLNIFHSGLAEPERLRLARAS